jgi:FlaG/FlaF family flagellin (archaellin)
VTLSALGIFSAAGAGGGVAGDYQLISTQILAATTNSITFTSLGDFSSTYKHLQLRTVAKSNQAGTGSGGVSAFIEINTGTLNAHYLYTDGGSFLAGGVANGFMLNLVRAGATNAFSASITDFLDPYSTTKNKTVRTLGGYNSELAFSSGLWQSTNSVTSITIRTTADNFDVGSRFSLYGLK